MFWTDLAFFFRSFLIIAQYLSIGWMFGVFGGFILLVACRCRRIVLTLMLDHHIFQNWITNSLVFFRILAFCNVDWGIKESPSGQCLAWGIHEFSKVCITDSRNLVIQVPFSSPLYLISMKNAQNLMGFLPKESYILALDCLHGLHREKCTASGISR